MRALPKPLYVFQDVFNLCIEGVGDIVLRQRYGEILVDLAADAANYEALSAQANWWTIPPNHQRNSDVVVGRVIKSELKALYSSYMVGQEKPARSIYDRLMGSAPNERCPYCGVGRVTTLDHFLPKAKFPKLSVLVTNLVPACRDCNMGGKGTSIATRADDQPIHPYYDADTFNSAQWLYCDVNPTSPATINFYAQPPLLWSATAQARTHSHLRAFDLRARFSVEAAEELSTIRQIFIDYYDDASADERAQYLLSIESSESRRFPNSWKRALYQALGSSQWYCGGGYR